MFHPATPSSRAPVFRILTVLLLLASLGAFQASHLKHHYDHADRQAHDDRCAHSGLCVVFHTGTLTEDAFAAPRAGSAVIAQLPTAEVRTLGLLVLPRREARAPPVPA